MILRLLKVYNGRPIGALLDEMNEQAANGMIQRGIAIPHNTLPADHDHKKTKKPRGRPRKTKDAK